ncbi:uncharacterized transporter slc-17.2-like [Planococcus citri]|uniref:uncharacterized transporter slc-17.2-like n=1 Tax=Planococcus citri TaxID=170843 RepID=UPI0031FA160F
MNPKPSNQNLQLEAQQETLLNTPITEPVPLWHSKRFLVALFMALCHLNTVFSRFNISIAIVEMTYPKIIETENSTVTQPPEFSWDSATVGSTLSIFYYGGFVAFLVSFMVSRIGGATSCSLTMMVSGIITILHPISLQHSFFLFLVCRFIVGISESLLLISVLEIHSQWTPQNEKSKLISISTSGINIGVAIVHGVCALLAHTWGWRMIFYVTGSISLITSLLCSIFIKNRPSDDKRISKQELSYMQERIALSSKKEVMHPYRDIITSSAVWALLSGKFAVTFGVSFITTFLPMYIKDTTQSDINKVGLISSTPNVLNIFMLPICGILLDYGKRINISVTLMHKILIGGSFILTSILFASSATISNFIVSIICFLLIQTLLFVINLVNQIIIISIAPNSSSIVAGLCTAVLAVSCISTRSLTTSMTTNHTLEEWNRCLLVMGGVSLFGGVLFIVWGSSEAQPWSFVSRAEQDDQGCQIDEKNGKMIPHCLDHKVNDCISP